MEALQRMKDALDYIEDHLLESPAIDEIARQAYMSPFHFQRMFHMLIGMTLAEYMRRRKLTLAAQELASTSAKVVDVAMKHGYESPEAFAKAFRKIHGISPSVARSSGVPLKAFPRISFQLSLKGEKEMDYRMEEKAGFTVIGEELHTTCKEGENLREIPKFWGRANEDGLVSKLAELEDAGELVGLCLDMKPGSEEFTYMIGRQLQEHSAASRELLRSPGFSEREVGAYSWAVFTATGPMPGAIQTLFSRIFQEWFPATGYEHAGGPEIEVYPPGNPYADDYRSEVWIPVVKK
ncbi:AraC family transcriptional regulator [Paenibacillus sp. HB172176]|uniref:AraC family transcriptional regulator n=1 Tax=Paenibacillus sp. HB172176 TaxID=2493690 RepID=UPI0019812B86|nr:AraC family transcriptional regulator [Paenibacillus sp. HB172176]